MGRYVKKTNNEKMGRPLKEIDQKQFENLCGLQCTEEEIASFFGVCRDTLDDWCHRTYDSTFSTIYKDKSALGKMSLRRMQMRLAEKSAAMAIFLGKQYLGQTDKVEETSEERVTIVSKLEED